jgi:hypothetical protein
MPISTTSCPAHLTPYFEAAATFGGGFRALLWASPKTQRARFEAIRRSVNLNDRVVLDAGCGRADLLGHLIQQHTYPAQYIGLEAIESLAVAAEAHGYPNARIIRGDFVVEPVRLFVGADVIVFSGSLNTLDDLAFYATLGHAIKAASQTVVFNFLSSAALAGKKYLFWRSPGEVAEFVRPLCAGVKTCEDYLHGDCTMVLGK